MKIQGFKNKWIRIPLKILMWIFLGVIALVLLVVIAVQLPPVQNFIAGKAVSYLEDKLGTEVKLGSVNIGFPKTVSINDFYLADQNNDTLLSVEQLQVGVDMFGLLKNNLHIRSVNLEGVRGVVKRLYPDTTYNYSFILDAFASEDTTGVSSDTAAGMNIKLDRIKLAHISLLYDDTLTGTKARLMVGEFETSFRKFDLENMLFSVNEITLKNSSVNYLQTPALVKTPEDTTTTVLPEIGFADLVIENLKTEYNSPADGNALTATIGNLEIESDSIDVRGQNIALERVFLANSSIEFEQSQPQQFDTIITQVTKEQGSEKEITTPEWVFTLNDLELRNNSAKYDNADSLPSNEGMDFNHLQITSLDIKSENIQVHPGNIKLNLLSFNFEEKSGFTLSEFSSAISYDTTNITLANLRIETPNTSISDHLEANFSSVTMISDSIEKVEVIIDLQDTRIAVKDILYFMPELRNTPQVDITGNEVFNIEGNINGSLSDLTIKSLNINNGSSTSVALSGRLKNTTSPDDLYASLQNFSLKTTRSDILAYTTKETLPDNISIPPVINLSGSFTGYLKNFNAAVDLNTSYGDITANVNMSPGKGNKEVPFTASLEVDDLDLGEILMQPDTLGPVSLTMEASGMGFNPDSLNAEVRATVHDAFYNQYTYRDLNLEGFIVHQSFHGEIWMNDDNLDFNYTGYVNAHPDSLAMIFDLNLAGADLKALNLSPDEFMVSGSVSSDLAKRYGPNPLGTLKIYDLNILRENLACPVDSIVIESLYRNDSSLINIRSRVLNASFGGDLVLQYLPATMIRHLNQYFAFADSLPAEPPVDQNFAFNISVDDPNLLCENLLPALKDFNPLAITGEYNSEQMQLVARAEIPRLNYNDIVVDSLYLDISSNSEKLDYELNLAEVSNPTLALELFDLTGNISDNKIIYDVNAAKSDTFNVLNTGGAFTKDGNEYTLIMNEPLVLNNTAWNIDPDNVITFNDKGLNAQRVILSGEDQIVSLITQPGDNIPLKVSFENFRLSNLSLIIEKDKPLARGELNGYVVLFETEGVSAFTSDLTIDSLSFMEVPVGNITLMADNSTNPEQFDLELTLQGNGNNMTAEGFYRAHDSIGDLNIDVDISRLNMAAVEPFTFGQVTRMSGFLSGGLQVNGTTENPDIRGELRFNDVAFNAPYANTYLRVPDNSLIIRNQRLLFDDLTLVDTLNNKAVVNGYADFSDLANLILNINVETNDFLAMNSTRSDGDMPVYGTVLLDSDISVTGTPSSPVIDMKVQLNNGTNLVYVMPESEYTLNESEGIVVFTDSLSARSRIMSKDSIETATAGIEGITVNASITFQPEAVLKMLIDPVSGDSMYVSGEGALNFNMTPAGEMSLTGRYDINSGGYNITLNELIKRQFSLKEGSYITWTGDIMDAFVDLTAVYTVRTSPLNLLEDQMAGLDEAERNRYRNALTFHVNLNITGELMSPDISFGIEQPEDEKGALDGIVNAKLNELETDESQLNKQVFALLTLNRFIGQDPFETGNAPLTVESATRASASRILTQQFNALSDKYIKGVDLDVGINSFEDYSTGEEEGRTQLQLGVSKEFLNDRITVQVGGNVELEGERARENRASEIAGNIMVEYKVTPNGRYRLRGFRKIEYENPIESELINTGIGFSYTRDFLSLRQIFWSKERLAERRKKLQEEQRKNNDPNEKP